MPDHAAHEWPVGLAWFAGVEQLTKADVGGTAGQVVVITGMVISGPTAIVAQ